MPQYRHTAAPTMVCGMDAMCWYRTDQALASLHIPVVVLRGAGDRIASQDWLARLSGLALGSLQVVGGAAHMVPLTHPDAVAAALREVASAASKPGPGGAKPIWAWTAPNHRDEKHLAKDGVV